MAVTAVAAAAAGAAASTTRTDDESGRACVGVVESYLLRPSQLLTRFERVNYFALGHEFTNAHCVVLHTPTATCLFHA